MKIGRHSSVLGKVAVSTILGDAVEEDEDVVVDSVDAESEVEALMYLSYWPDSTSLKSFTPCELGSNWQYIL